MDRLSSRLDSTQAGEASETPAIPLGEGEEPLVTESRRHAAIPEGLFNLHELDVFYEDDTQTLWTYMNPTGRPSFTPRMLSDFENWQVYIEQGFGPEKVPLRFLVLGSRAPGVFCFGGDLNLFQRLIRERDREALVRYGHRCCKILHRNMASLDLPMLTGPAVGERSPDLLAEKPAMDSDQQAVGGHRVRSGRSTLPLFCPSVRQDRPEIALSGDRPLLPDSRDPAGDVRRSGEAVCVTQRSTDVGVQPAPPL